MKPEEALKATNAYLKEIEKAISMSVKVGLPADKVGGKVYGGGMGIMEIGAIHEYGGTTIPQRSFLRMPFEVKQPEINKFIKGEFAKVLDGKSTADKSLNRIGVMTSNISKEAFKSNGFGQWAALAPETVTKKEKAGKQNTLIWSGLLRGSITWSVQ